MPGRSSKVLFCVLRRFNQIMLMTLFQAFLSRKRMQHMVNFARSAARESDGDDHGRWFWRMRAKIGNILCSSRFLCWNTCATAQCRRRQTDRHSHSLTHEGVDSLRQPMDTGNEGCGETKLWFPWWWILDVREGFLETGRAKCSEQSISSQNHKCDQGLDGVVK